MIFYILVTTFLLLLTFLFIKTNQKFRYWSDRGVRSPSWIPLLGHQLDLMLKPKKWLYIDRLYKEYKSDCIWGMYEICGIKNLYVSDLDLIRDILIKEADHFIDRRVLGTDDKYYKEFLTLLEGERWKAMRAILSPTFSSGKIKGMFKIVHEKSKSLITRSRKEIEESGSIDAKYIFGLFTMDVISSCAFGFDARCLLDENSSNSRFMQSTSDVLHMSKTKLLKWCLLNALPPWVCKCIGLRLTGATQDYLVDILSKAYDDRIKSGFRRGDYLDLLIEAKEENDKKKGEKKIDFSKVSFISEALLFLIGGFDTTSFAITFVIYTLAKNPSKQDILRQHLKKVLKSENEFSYQNIMECQYLEAVVNETMRLFPISFILERRCVQDYCYKGKNLMIEKGTTVTIPSYSIQRDSQYWENPEDFIPERFLTENKDKIIPFTHMPFGLGPRNCIAMRFAMMEVKLCIAEMCSAFEMRITPGHEDIEFQTSTLGLKPTAGSIKINLRSL